MIQKLIIALSVFVSFLPALRADNVFRVKAFHLDMRTEVMTMDALVSLADRLAGQGVNTLIMEWEATFPFDENAVLCNRNAFTKEEILGFVSHCSGKGIDVIPLQNCFGHCEYILKNERYRHIREDARDPSQVCPLKKDAAAEVFDSIFREVASLHQSRYFHIGADETYLLGNCRECGKVAGEHGKSKLFVDYVNEMCAIVRAMGKTPVMWADIILKHPESLDELPEDLIYVDWNYGWDPNRFGKLDNLFSRGVKMWGASALRSGPDNIYITQWLKHFNNIAVFVEFARRNGYEGMVQTSWSTSGTYGYWYDSGNEILSMQPIRLVYPMSAFGILEDAFCEAVGSSVPFVPETFVKKYAMTHLGMDARDAEVIWKWFSMPQEQITIKNGKAADISGRGIDEILDECEDMRSALSSVRARYSREELEHWRLMLDIRISYLRFKKIEAVFQSDDFERKEAYGLLAELKSVIAGDRSIDRRFRKLNGSYLKDAEIEYICSMRSLKSRSIYDQLVNMVK